jgi:methylmalonyl-CoA mutase
MWEKLRATSTRSRATKAAARASWCQAGQDGHDRGSKVVASAFADLGSTSTSTLFQTPEEAARQAIENDVHRGGRVHARRRPQDAGPRVDRRTARARRADVVVFVGGVVPRRDYAMLYAAGGRGIYGPATRDSRVRRRRAGQDPVAHAAVRSAS